MLSQSQKLVVAALWVTVRCCTVGHGHPLYLNPKPTCAEKEAALRAALRAELNQAALTVELPWQNYLHFDRRPKPILYYQMLPKMLLEAHREDN